MSLHKELSFEIEICKYLAANSWLYTEGDAATYDRARALFYKRLLPLLEFGREREGIDLSKVKLTHHKLTNKGRQALNSEKVRRGIKDILLNHSRLWELLRDKGAA